jgi:hypothetical protein
VGLALFFLGQVDLDVAGVDTCIDGCDHHVSPGLLSFAGH